MASERETSAAILVEFPEMEKSFDSFFVKINGGEIHKGEVLAVMGANGLGKSTFLKMLSGEIVPDKGQVDKLNVVLKEQYPDPNIGGTVGEWLRNTAGEKFSSGWYRHNILEKLGLGKVMDNEVCTLSGGELQKFYVALTLSKDAEVYAFDEPSAFVDVEDRLMVAEVIKDFITKNEVCAVVVDLSLIHISEPTRPY